MLRAELAEAVVALDLKNEVSPIAATARGATEKNSAPFRQAKKRSAYTSWGGRETTCQVDIVGATLVVVADATKKSTRSYIVDEDSGRGLYRRQWHMLNGMRGVEVGEAGLYCGLKSLNL